MERKKTPTDYRALAQKRGFRWLGPEVPNVHTKSQWECQQGHRWWVPFSSIRKGRGCPICANRYPKTPTDYQTMAEKRGFRWLGPEVANTKLKTTWECGHGHHWQATYTKIHQGSGCPTCAKGPRKTRLDYQALAQKRGFRWLGQEVPSVHTKTEWECDQGHRWRTSYSNLREGTGCPTCAKNRRRKTPADYRAMAQKRGFRWLEVEVATTADKTQWECKQGHRWWATYKKIHQGTGCPICAGKRPPPPSIPKRLF